MENIKPLAMSTASKDNNGWTTKNGILAIGVSSMVPEKDVPKFSLDLSQHIVLAKASYLSLSTRDSAPRQPRECTYTMPLSFFTGEYWLS